MDMTQEEIVRFALVLREARRVAAEIERDEGRLVDGGESPVEIARLPEKDLELAAA